MADLGFCMASNNVRIITFAWGGYVWLLTPFITSLHRHWDGVMPNMTIMSDRPISDVNIRSWEDTWFPLRQGWRDELFSDRLRDVLKCTVEPIVMISCPDRFVVGAIPGDVVESLATYMLARGDIVCCGLASRPSLDGHHEHLETWDGLAIVRCSDNTHCSLSNGIHMDLALFNRDLLFELLELFWTPWKVEVYGTKNVLKAPNIRSVSVHPGLFKTYDIVKTVDGKSTIKMSDMLDSKDSKLILEHMPIGDGCIKYGKY